MTEEEAKTKWCPMTRKVITKSGFIDINRTHTNENICNCVGSECMMWQWEVMTGQSLPSGQKTTVTSKDCGSCGLAK